jgi:hypothetical protein
MKEIFDKDLAKTGGTSVLGLASSSYQHVKAFFAEASSSTSYDVSIARIIALLTVAYLIIRIVKALRKREE